MSAWLVVLWAVSVFAAGVFGAWLTVRRADVARSERAAAERAYRKARRDGGYPARLKLPSEMRDLLPERDMVAEAALLRRMAGIFQQQLPDGFAPADRPGIRMAVMMLHSFADESERQAQAEALAKAPEPEPDLPWEKW